MPVLARATIGTSPPEDAGNDDVFLYLNTFILYTISSPTRSKNWEKRMFILRFGAEKCFRSKINRQHLMSGFVDIRGIPIGIFCRIQHIM